MKYDPKAQILKNKNTTDTYTIRRFIRTAHPKMSPLNSRGNNLHIAYDSTSQQQVSIRSVHYRKRERDQGIEGYKKGRMRFLRQLDLINRVQSHTVVFPEPLNLLYDYNRFDFNVHKTDIEEFARHEPIIVYQWLNGSTLLNLRPYDAKERSKLWIGESTGRYWFKRKAEPIEDARRFKELETSRFARFMRKVSQLVWVLHQSNVVHLDLKPEHVLMMPQDEVPRLLGMGNLAPLHHGMLSANDIGLGLGTAGYVAPELVDPKQWHQDFNGEAIMLYSLGATMLSVILTGPQWNLTNTWIEKGRSGIDELLAMLSRCTHNRQNDTLLTLIRKMMIPNPKERLKAINLRSVIRELKIIADHNLRYNGGSSHVSSSNHGESMTCRACQISFRGSKKRNTFTYHNHTFTLCPTHIKEAYQKKSYTAPVCGHSVTELQGVIWAREWSGYAARKYCQKDCSHRPY